MTSDSRDSEHPWAASATIINSKSGRSRQLPLTLERRADLLAGCHASGLSSVSARSDSLLSAAAVSVPFARLTSRSPH